VKKIKKSSLFFTFFHRFSKQWIFLFFFVFFPDFVDNIKSSTDPLKLFGCSVICTQCSSANAEKSRFIKQNFMSDKKRNTFFHLIFCSRAKNIRCTTCAHPPTPTVLEIKRLFIALEKKCGEKKCYFFYRTNSYSLTWPKTNKPFGNTANSVYITQENDNN
jgi:hypothetical protein